MTDKKRVVVIGSGIGGLTSAVKLAHTGNYDVQVYERLSFAGGRFTQHDHDGYAVPTGAVHMVPHGMKGPFAKMMLGKRSKGGLELGRHGVEFLPSMKFACRNINGVHQGSNGPMEIMRWFPFKDTLNLPRLLLARAKNPAARGKRSMVKLGCASVFLTHSWIS